MSQRSQTRHSLLARFALRFVANYLAVRSEQERDAARYKHAERLARKALVFASHSTALGDPLRVALWNSLGMTHKYQGRFAAAAYAYSNALRSIYANRPADPLA